MHCFVIDINVILQSVIWPLPMLSNDYAKEENPLHLISDSSTFPLTKRLSIRHEQILLLSFSK